MEYKKLLFSKVPAHLEMGLLFLYLIASVFIYTKISFIKIQVQEENLISENTTLLDKIANLEKQVYDTQKNTALLSSVLLETQSNNQTLQSIVASISGQVGTLEKLAQTDKELLQKYSKVYFLNEHYVPISLTYINPKFVSSSTTSLQIHSNVDRYLESLLLNAEVAGLGLRTQSAYRSFGTQETLKQSYKIIYGTGANAFSAEQGYSEHQLGTTIDFSTKTLGGTLSGFDKTSEYTWLLNHAHEYGFVISYPKENTYYVFEPWHWRFVGVALANKIYQDHTYFYNLDQRIIDSYLANIFD